MMKHILITFTAVLLASCGFTPMHAPQLGSGGSAFKNIDIDVIEPEDIANQEGAFWVEQALYDRLGKDGGTHRLEVEPEFRRRKLGLSAEDIATRFDFEVRLKYRLIDKSTDKVLDQGNLRTSSTFGAPQDPYARATSEQAATRNVSKEIVDRLIIELAAYYANADES